MTIKEALEKLKKVLRNEKKRAFLFKEESTYPKFFNFIWCDEHEWETTVVYVPGSRDVLPCGAESLHVCKNCGTEAMKSSGVFAILVSPDKNVIGFNFPGMPSFK